MTSFINNHILKTSLFLSLVALLFGSCAKESRYDFKGQLSNQIEMDWKAGEGPKEFVVKQEDIRSGLLQELAAQQEEHPRAELTSVTVHSVFMVSEDITDFSYLDALDLYLVATDPTDLGTSATEAKGLRIASMVSDSKNAPSLQLETVDVELLKELSDSGNYDLYLVGSTNSKIDDVAYDRLADIKITFDIAISE